MLDEPILVKEKLVKCGDFIEHYEYSKPYWKNVPLSPEEKKNRLLMRRVKKPNTAKIMRDDNVKRARSNLRRLINSNPQLNRFLTLTFKENIKELENANPFFNSFIKRIKRRYPNFKYVAVPEFQERGAVHYHLLCNLPFVPVEEITFIWGNGFAFLRKVDSVTNMGAYMSKYLSKQNFSPRYFRKRKFFYSLDVERPLIFESLDDIAFFFINLFYKYNLSNLSQILIYENQYLTDFVGMLKYKQYSLKVVCTCGSP